MSEDEDRLYGLMEIAERQQVAVQAALEGLTAERRALAQEREAFAGEAMRLEASLRHVVRLEVANGFAGAGNQGVEAVRVATEPLIGKLAHVTAGSELAEAALRRVVSWASWRLLGWIIALMVALVLLGWLATTAVIWWDTGRVSDLQDQIAQLRDTRDQWVNAGMLGKITYCDPGHRPCVAVNESAGPFGPPGGDNDYRVLKGY